MTRHFQVLKREKMGDLGVEMAEIVEMEERVVAMKSTEAKTTKRTIMDKQVMVAAEITTDHKEGALMGNGNATEAALQAGPWEG